MVEAATEENGDPIGRQTDTHPAIPETADETAVQALRLLDGMMPEIIRLAEESKAGNIQFHAGRLRGAVQRALTDVPDTAGHRDPQEGAAPEANGRDARLLAWARGTQYDAPTPFDVQGRMISTNRTWAEDVMDAEVAAQSQGRDRLLRETRNDATYRVLKALARAFDPQDHGTFRVYAEPFLRGAARHCLASGHCAIPDRVCGDELQTLLEEAALPKIPPAAPKARPADPDRLERNARLSQWTRRHGLWGTNTFHRQGTIINAHTEMMRGIAAGMSGTMGTLENKDLQTAGYRALKGLVVLFDPAEHGDDFWAWAAPYVRAAMQRCNDAGSMVIPDKPDAAFLQGLLAGTPPKETVPRPDANTPPHENNPAEPAAPTHSATDEHSAVPSHPAEGGGDDRNTTDAAAAPSASNPPSCDTPANPPVAEADNDAPQDLPETPDQNPPDPEPPVHQSTADEIAEQKRQRRFCRFARDSFGIEVGQEDYAGAVEGVCGKLENLVGSTVSGMHLPGKFRGGKTAVRKEGVRLLPDIVVRYDPPNIPDAGEAKGRFITHVKQRLAPQMEAFVKQ